MTKTDREIFNEKNNDDLTEEEKDQRTLESLQQAGEGKTIPHEKVMEWLKSLGTDKPLKRPEPLNRK